MRITPDDMAATKRMHKPHFGLLLVVVAVDVFALKLYEMLFNLIFVIANVHKAIIILMTLFFMKHHVLFLFFVKSIVLVSLLGL